MQVLPAVQRKSFGDRLNEGIGRGLDTAQRFQQESMQQQANARNRQAIQELTGMDLEDPEMQKEAFKNYMQQQLQEQKFGYESEKAGQKLREEKKEKLAPLEGALSSVQEMKNLRKQGNLGIGATYSPFAETRKHAGEYSTLGKSLIQYVSTIPVRNQKEFETLAHDLIDPNITDAYAEGVLNKMEKLITDAMGEFEESEGQQGPSKNKPKKLPDIMSFIED
jgi:hypothetical protein